MRTVRIIGAVAGGVLGVLLPAAPAPADTGVGISASPVVLAGPAHAGRHARRGRGRRLGWATESSGLGKTPEHYVGNEPACPAGAEYWDFTDPCGLGPNQQINVDVFVRGPQSTGSAATSFSTTITWTAVP